MKEQKQQSTLIKRIFSNRFLQGSILLTASNFLTGFLNYLFNVFTGRALGPEGYGEIATFFSYLMIFSIPIGIAVSTVILKTGKQEHPEAFILGLRVWVLEKMKRWWWMLLLPLLLIPFVPSLTNLNPIVGYSLIPMLMIGYLSGLFDGALQGLHLFWLFAVITISVTVIKLLGALGALFFFPQIEVVLACIVLSSILKLIFSNITLQRRLKKIKHIVIEKRIRHLWSDRDLLITACSGASIVILSNVDVMYAKRVLAADDAGLYSAWSLFAKIILYILGPLISMSFIYFSSKKESTRHHLYLIGLFVLFISAGLANYYAYWFYPRFFIDLIFGTKFHPLLPFMNWAAVFGLLYLLITFMNTYFLTQKSKSALVLTGSIPFYIAGLFIFGRDLGSIMAVNIYFSVAVVGVYCLIFAWSRIKILLS